MTIEERPVPPISAPVEAPPAMMKAQLARRNLVAAFLQRGASLVSGFIRIPLLLHTFGPSRYGIWLGIFAAANISAITDFGLQTAVTQQVAELRGRGRPEEIRSVVATAFWLCMACFVVVSAATLVWVAMASPFESQAAAAGVASRDVRVLLLFACIASFAVQPPKILVAAQYGFERMYALYICDVISILVNVFGLWILTGVVGGSLMILAAWALLWELVLSLIVVLVLAIRNRSHLSVAWGDFRRERIKPLVRDAGAFFFNSVAYGMRFTFDGLVILAVLGPSFVPRYEPSMRLFLTALTVVPVVFGTLWPSFAESAARQDWEWVNRTFGIATVTVLGVAVIEFALTQIVGRDFVLRWVGVDGFGGDAILLALGLWFLVTAWVQIAGHLTISMGGAASVMRWGLLEGATNVVLTVVLARTMGLTGVAIASLVAVSLFGAVPLTRRLLALSRGAVEMPIPQIARLGVIALVAVGIAALRRAEDHAILPVHTLVPVAFIVGAAATAAVWFFVFSGVERRRLLGQIKAIVPRSGRAG